MIITKKIPYREIEGVFKFVVEARTGSVSNVIPPDASWYTGSLVLETSTGKIYGLTSGGTWVEQNAEEPEE